MEVTFADVVLDPDRHELARGGEPIGIEPQVFDVLAYLVAHRDRMVPKTELLDEIWGDRFVSDSALSSRIKSARQAIGDNGRDQRLIRTIHGRGFRFVGEVDEPGGGRDPTPVATGIVGPDGPGGRPDAPRWSPGAVADTVVAIVHQGRGATVEVVGPSGSARTDLLDEVLDTADRAGLLIGRSGETLEPPALAGVLGALDEWVQRRPALLDDVPAPCAAELRSVLAGGAPSSRQRLLLSVRELAAAAGRAGGAVVGIDSVHLIDGASVDLLRHLSSAVRRLAVVVVVTHRDGFRIDPDAHSVVVESAATDPDDLVPPSVRVALARAAVVGERVDPTELAAAAGLDEEQARRTIELAVASGALVPEGSRFRFADAALVDALAADVPRADQADVLRAVAAAAVAAGAPPSRVADLLIRAGDHPAAVPHQADAAAAAAGRQLHAEVLERTEGAAVVLDPAIRLRMLELRADALAALGSPDAVRWYRQAVGEAPADRQPWLRARLARAYLMSSDLEGATEAMDGVEPTGAPEDGGVLLVAGMVAYFQGDLDRAERLAESARPYALVPGAPAQMLDVIALQGMIAHSRGEWFDRLRREMRFASDSGQLASTIFDGHLCASQYVLYGPSGYAEVIRLAAELGRAAAQQGSRPAAGFALTLAGEANLLSGDLDAARQALIESVALHAELGADTGHAHAMQRLADVELALGDRAAAERLCRRALPLARWSPLATHLLQRIYGTLIAAAPDPPAAAATVDESRAVLDGPVACEFCQVMVAVPAAAALAAVGRLDEAHAELEVADQCAARWDGPAWRAAVDEARAMVTRVEGDEPRARLLLTRALAGFEAAGQPLDVSRCREALGDAPAVDH